MLSFIMDDATVKSENRKEVYRRKFPFGIKSFFPHIRDFFNFFFVMRKSDECR